MHESHAEPEWLIRSSGLFDAAHYAQSAGIDARDVATALRHYLEIGEAAGLSPNPLFDSAWYAARYAAARPLLDYLEGRGVRDPHPLFATSFYLEQSPELGGRTPLAHYLERGWKSGLDPHPLFSSNFYVDSNADVRMLGYNPLVHFLSNGWREHRLPCPDFDMRFYAARNPDVTSAGINPLIHYVLSGGVELRQPSEAFDAAWYAAQMQASGTGGGQNPLVHYRTVGRAAGWLMKPAEWQLDKNGMLEAEAAIDWAGNAVLQARNAGGVPRPVALMGPGAPIPAEGLVVVLRDGDALQPGAAEVLAGVPGLLCTFDAVAPGTDGAVLPVLLPGANPILLLAMPEPPSFCVDVTLLRRHPLPTNPAKVLGWFHRLVQAALSADGLRHVPAPLVSVPLDRIRPVSPASLPSLRAVADSIGAPAATPKGEVSVVICTKDAGHLLTQLVRGMVEPGLPQLREVVVVVNRPENGFARAYHERLRHLPQVKLVEYDKPYNFSDQANLGVRQCSGEFVLLLNDDIVPVGPHWLSHLLAPFNRAEVAIAGPLLLYPDETVQHAGMFMGFNNVAGHTLRGARLPYHGTAAALLPQNVSAVTGAVMMVRRSVWDGLTGFDTLLATFLQDVDLCLRARRMGWEIAYTPHAVLFHMESISARPTLRDPAMMDRRGREYARFARRWGAAVYQDPFHSAHWQKDDESLRTVVAVSPATMQGAFHG